MKISEDVANVLSNSAIEDTKLYLPEGQLDRKLYTAVNKVLTAINGKWVRKEKAHVFSENPSDIIEQILLTGEYTSVKQEFQFFETPLELAKHLVELASIKPNETVLEPSAGKGRIAQFCEYGCDCIELNPENKQYLLDNGYNVVADDFMEFDKNYDVIIANPPFTKQQDINHVNKMIDLANNVVVSVMSASVLFRTDKKSVAFRERVHNLGGTIEPLPDATFKESGTLVKTCVVVVEK